MLTFDLARLPLAPGAYLLDVGCGGGRHVRAMRRRAGVRAVAIDLGAGEVRHTAASLRELDALPPEAGGSLPEAASWLALRATSYGLPFRAGSFDCVILSEVLEHLTMEDTALDEVARVLKPDGVLAVSVPRTVPEAVCWMLSPRYRNSPGGHVRIYRRSRLRRLLQKHGFKLIGAHHAHALHVPYWWLRCLVGLDREEAWLVRLYHRFLVWDLMQSPRIARAVERALNPIMGKSLVFYATRS